MIIRESKLTVMVYLRFTFLETTKVGELGKRYQIYSDYRDKIVT